MSIKVNHLSYVYLKKSQHPVKALSDVSFTIEDHSFSAIIGETGSGKSTLIQNLNGLLIPQSGTIEIDQFSITSEKHKNKDIKSLRKHLGIVFQFPEYQLFEESVIKDVSYGPKNFGFSEEVALQKAKDALQMVGLNETYYERSPFELSGGEKRRVAIAGILAIDPEILVLDEPTAGLDPNGSEVIMNLLSTLYKNGKSIIIVTHDMDLVFKYAQKVFVFQHGKLMFEGKPNQLFNQIDESSGLEVPPLYKLGQLLNNKGFSIDLEKIKEPKDLVNEIKKELKNV